MSLVTAVINFPGDFFAKIDKLPVDVFREFCKPSIYNITLDFVMMNWTFELGTRWNELW